VITHFKIFVGLERKNSKSVDNVLVEQCGFLLFPAVRRRGPLRLFFCGQFVLFATVQLMFLSVHTLSPFPALTAFDTLLLNIRFHVITTRQSSGTQQTWTRRTPVGRSSRTEDKYRWNPLLVTSFKNDRKWIIWWGKNKNTHWKPKYYCIIYLYINHETRA